MIGEALRPTPGGILLAVVVRPASGTSRVTGYDAWRRVVTIDVSAPPEHGAANRELEAFIARILGRGAIARIVRGRTSRRKTVLVSGVPPARIERSIEGEMP